MIVELLEKLIANTTAGGGAGAGGVDSIQLSSLATVNDVEATHYWEDVVLHCFPEFNKL